VTNQAVAQIPQQNGHRPLWTRLGLRFAPIAYVRRISVVRSLQKPPITRDRFSVTAVLVAELALQLLFLAQNDAVVHEWEAEN
jgi:hypothetical protein